MGHAWQAIYEFDDHVERLPNGRRKIKPAILASYYCRTCGARKDAA